MTRSVHPSPSGGIADGAAIGASIACLIHCLGLPLLITLAPAIGAVVALPHWFHLAGFACALPASAIAMHRGYRRHGMILPFAAAAIGLTLIGLGAFGGFRVLVETGLTVAGSVALVAGHLGNWRLRRAATKGNAR